MKTGIELVPKGWIKRLERLVELGYYPSVEKALRIGLLMVYEDDTVLFGGTLGQDKRIGPGRLDNESIVEKLVETYGRKSLQDIKELSELYSFRQHIYISAAKEAVLRKENFIAVRKKGPSKSFFEALLEPRL